MTIRIGSMRADSGMALLERYPEFEPGAMIISLVDQRRLSGHLIERFFAADYILVLSPDVLDINEAKRLLAERHPRMHS